MSQILASMDVHLYKDLRTSVARSKTERGGILQPIQTQNGYTLVEAGTNNGDHNGVKFANRGVIEYHTHPSTCVNNKCNVKLPSPEDMLLIIAGCLCGTQYHLVLTGRGNFVCSLPTPTFIQLSEMSMLSLLEYMRNLYIQLDRISELHVNDKLTLEKARYAFIQACRNAGVNIDAIRADVVPQFTVSLPIDSVTFPFPVAMKSLVSSAMRT